MYLFGRFIWLAVARKPSGGFTRTDHVVDTDIIDIGFRRNFQQPQTFGLDELMHETDIAGTDIGHLSQYPAATEHLDLERLPAPAVTQDRVDELLRKDRIAQTNVSAWIGDTQTELARIEDMSKTATAEVLERLEKGELSIDEAVNIIKNKR